MMEIEARLDIKLQRINLTYNYIKNVITENDITSLYDLVIKLVFKNSEIGILDDDEKKLILDLIVNFIIENDNVLSDQILDSIIKNNIESKDKTINNAISYYFFRQDEILDKYFDDNLITSFKILYIINVIYDKLQISCDDILIKFYSNKVYNMMSKEQFLYTFINDTDMVIMTLEESKYNNQKIINYIIDYINDNKYNEVSIYSAEILHIICVSNSLNKLKKEPLLSILKNMYEHGTLFCDVRHKLVKCLEYIPEDIIYEFCKSVDYNNLIYSYYTFFKKLTIDHQKELFIYSLKDMIENEITLYSNFLPGFKVEYLNYERIDDYEKYLMSYIEENGINNINYFLKLSKRSFSVAFAKYLFDKGYKIEPNSFTREIKFEHEIIKLYMNEYIKNDKDISNLFKCIDRKLISIYDTDIDILLKYGYEINESSPSELTKSNRYYIEYIKLHKNEGLDNLKRKIGDKCPDLFFKLIFDDNFILDKSSRDYSIILSDVWAFELYLERTKDISIVDKVSWLRFSDNVINLLFKELDYKLTKNSPYQILSNPLSFELAIENGQSLDILKYANTYLSKRCIELIFEKYNYKIKKNSPSAILDNEFAFILALEKGQKLNIINYATFNISPKLLNIIFSDKYNYKLSKKSPRALRNETLAYILYIEKHKFDPNFNINVVNSCTAFLGAKLEEIIFSDEFDYKVTSESPKFILNSSTALKRALEKGQDISIVNYFVSSQFTIDTIKLIFSDKYDYRITSESPDTIKNSILAINLYIQKYKDNNLNIDAIDVSRVELSEDIVKLFIEKGYKINKNTPGYILEYDSIMKTYYENICSKFKNKVEINKILTDINFKYGYLNMFLEVMDNEDFFEYTKIDRQLDILKYIFYSKKEISDKFIQIINNGYYKTLIRIYDILSQSKWDVKIFKQLVINCLDNLDLWINLDDSKLTLDDKVKLYKILINGKKIKKDDLYIDCNQTINNFKNPLFMKLCNKTTREVKTLLRSLINKEKLDNLINSIYDEKIIELLENYRHFIDILQFLADTEDIDVITNILDKINKDKDIYNKIWYFFKDFDICIKEIYGYEISEKLTNFSELMNDTTNKSYIVTRKTDRDAYYIEDDFEYNGKKFYKGQKVDDIVLNGIPFVSMSHTLNAYGKGGKLSDFENPRVIGKPYICLSAIDDIRYGIVSRDALDIDSVTVLFDKLPPRQLVVSSPYDVSSNSDVNDLNISSDPGDFNPIRDNIIKTNSGYDGYNEYVYYRENLYPSGILVNKDEPSESEIKAALYLNVPLVRINRKMYPRLKNEDIETKENELKKYYKELYLSRKRKYKIESLKNMKELLNEFINNFFIEEDNKLKLKCKI